MSDKPISVGDLVMVVRPLSCGHGEIGTIGIVEKLEWRGTEGNCIVCGALVSDNSMTAILSTGRWKMVSRLKRIDPGILSEDVPTDEKVSA